MGYIGQVSYHITLECSKQNLKMSWDRCV